MQLAGKNIKDKGYDKFGTKGIQIPKARFFVVYNGKDEMPALPVLDLGDVQVTVRTKNIHFDQLVDKSTRNAVAGYARFVDLAKTMSVNDAIACLIKEGYLQDFLSRKEMRDMFVAAQFASEFVRYRKDVAEVFSYDQELIDFGMQQGMQQRAIATALNLIKMNLTDEQIAQATDLDILKVAQLRNELSV